MGVWYSWLTHLPCTQESPVRIWVSPLCNDSETNDGTDAKNEMETYDVNNIRNKPYSHYKTYLSLKETILDFIVRLNDNGRMAELVYRAGLENQSSERGRGFESYSFRKNCKVLKLADKPSCLEGDDYEIG
jgi:hypothetical protein